MSRKALPDAARAFLRGLGITLRDLRREQGLLQEQVGARAGVSGSRVGEIERGIVDTSVSRLWSLALAMGAAPSRVLRRYELTILDVRAVDEMRARLVAGIRKVAPRDLDMVIAIVERFARTGAADVTAK